MCHIWLLNSSTKPAESFRPWSVIRKYRPFLKTRWVEAPVSRSLGFKGNGKLTEDRDICEQMGLREI